MSSGGTEIADSYSGRALGLLSDLVHPLGAETRAAEAAAVANMDSLTSIMRGKLCVELGRSPIELSLSLGRGWGQVRFPQATEPTPRFPHSGRAAIRFAAYVW